MPATNLLGRLPSDQRLKGTQFSFNAGELSPEAEGRNDLAKFGSSCRVLKNFIPRVLGPARKRPGLRFVREVKTSTNVTRLIAFEFSDTQAYILEFGNLYFRVYMNGGVVLSGPNPVEVATPYNSADLAKLQMVQSADTLYLVHPQFAPRKITRTSHTAWTITTITFDWPAFRSENGTDTTVFASAKTGAVTLTASTAIFAVTDVGRTFKFRELVAANHPIWTASKKIKWNNSEIPVGDTAQYGGNVYELTNKHGEPTTDITPPIHTEQNQIRSDGDWDWKYIHSGEGYVTITAFISATQVTGIVTQVLPNSVVGVANATKLWSFGAWTATAGYPRAISFYEDRLWFAGTASDPQSLWASVLGDYENFRSLPTDVSSMLFTISDDEVNVIEWLRGARQLIIGTAGGIFPAAGADPDKPVSPSNTLQAPKHSDESVQAGIQAHSIGSSLLYVSRSGRGLMETTYDFANDSYATQDLAILADHLIAAGGITRMAHQRRPDRTLWLVTGDGRLLGVSYSRQDDVTGWHQHPVGGSFAGGAAIVESIATIPHPDGDQDQLWVIVKRTIGGVTKRYIEVLEKPFLHDTLQADAFFVDSGLTYTGVPVTVLAGLTHLIGETVWAWADGITRGPFTVSGGGTITLPVAASKAHAGYAYNADIAIQRPEAALRDGSIQGRLLRQSAIVFRFYRTSEGVQFGSDVTKLFDVLWTQFQDPGGAPMTLYSGDTRELPFQGPINTDGSIVMRHKTPGPCTLLAVMPRFTVEG